MTTAVALPCEGLPSACIALTIMLLLVVAVPVAANAQGWYLMAPASDTPRRAATGTFTWSEPLHDWRISQSFDRAEDCEQARALNAQTWERQLRQTIREYSDNKLDTNTYIKETDAQQLETARARTAQCISAADPRLAPRSPR